MKHKKYIVYLLLKNGKPVYVGCTCNLNNRLSKHKQNKDFDSHYKLKTYNTKKEALCAENSLIRFISVFGGDQWLNSKDCLLELDGFYIRERNKFGGYNS